MGGQMTEGRHALIADACLTVPAAPSVASFPKSPRTPALRAPPSTGEQPAIPATPSAYRRASASRSRSDGSSTNQTPRDP